MTSHVSCRRPDPRSHPSCSAALTDFGAQQRCGAQQRLGCARHHLHLCQPCCCQHPQRVVCDLCSRVKEGVATAWSLMFSEACGSELNITKRCLPFQPSGCQPLWRRPADPAQGCGLHAQKAAMGWQRRETRRRQGRQARRVIHACQDQRHRVIMPWIAVQPDGARHRGRAELELFTALAWGPGEWRQLQRAGWMYNWRSPIAAKCPLSCAHAAARCRRRWHPAVTCCRQDWAHLVCAYALKTHDSAHTL